jgi:hypothetical protein
LNGSHVDSYEYSPSFRIILDRRSRRNFRSIVPFFDLQSAILPSDPETRRRDARFGVVRINAYAFPGTIAILIFYG